MCESDPRYSQGYMYQLTLDETRRNEAVFGLRRWKLPGPYSKHVKLLDTAEPNNTPFYTAVHIEVMENSQASPVQANDPVLVCLREHNNNQEYCGKYRTRHPSRQTESWTLWLLRTFLIVQTWVVKVIFYCPLFFIFAGLVIVVSLLFFSRFGCELSSYRKEFIRSIQREVG